MSGVPYIGEILSAAAALVWAVAVLFFKKTGENTPPAALNLFKSAVATALLVPTLVVAGTPFFPDRPLVDWALLAGSAFLGISLADTLFFLALEKLGAGLVAIVDTLYSPSVILLAFLVLGERPGLQALVGAGLVAAAIIVGAADHPPAGRTRKDIVEGVLFAACAMVAMAVGVVMMKPVLVRAPVLWASAVRLFFGGVGLLPLLLVRQHRVEAAQIFRPSRTWLYAIPAAVLGIYIAMVLWMAGFKYTLASAAAILNQLSTIFIFVLAAIFFKEPFTKRRALAVAMAFTGAVLVTLR